MWRQENAPIRLIFSTAKKEHVVRYAPERLPNKALTREYCLALPDEKCFAAEIETTRERVQVQRPSGARGARRA